MRSHISLLLPLTTLIVMIAGFCWGYKVMYLKRENTAEKTKKVLTEKVAKSVSTYNLLDPFADTATAVTAAAGNQEKNKNSDGCKSLSFEKNSKKKTKISVLKKWKKIFSSDSPQIRKSNSGKKVSSSGSSSKKTQKRFTMGDRCKSITPAKRNSQNSSFSTAISKKFSNSVNKRRKLENIQRKKKSSAKKRSGAKGFGRK